MSAQVPAPAENSFFERHATLLFVLVLVAGAALRVREMLRTPMWFEEIYIAMVSHLPARQVVETIGRDIHPPLGYLLEHGWEAIGGMGPLWLKSLSVTLSLIALAITFHLARRLLGAGPALLGCALFALAHGPVRFSQEAQPFALEWALVAGAVTCGIEWIERRRMGIAAGYVVLATLASYTHYESLAIVLVLAVWGAIDLRRDRAALWRWIGMHAPIAAFFAPQFPILVRQFIQEGAAHHGHFPYAVDWLALSRQLALGSPRLIPVFLVLASLPLFSAARRRSATLLWAVSALPPLSLRLWSLNFPRETMWVMLLFMPLVAAGLLMLPGRPLRAAVALALIAVALRTNFASSDFAEPIQLMRALREIGRGVRPGDPIVHAETHSLLFFRYYDPRHDQRLVWPAGTRVPYYEGGLMVPESWTIPPARWDRLRAADARWWAVSLHRAQIRHGGGFNRTGVEMDLLASRARATERDLPPVTLWASPAVAGKQP